MKHTKKIVFLFICVIVFSSFSFGAELEHIHYQNIKNFEVYLNDFIFAYNHQDYFDHYVFDDYWNLNYTREECIEKVTAFYNLLLENEEPENQEYLLLKGIVASYLYNLDATEYYSDAVETFTKIQELPGYDYRCLWFLGNFYIDSVRLKDGLELFNLVQELIPEDSIHPDFFYDYAISLHTASMPMKSLEAFEKYEKYSGKSIQENSIYSFIKNLIHEYDGSDTDSDMLMMRQVRNGKNGFILRPFGVWFSLPENADVSVAQFLEKQYLMYYYLTAKKSDGADVRYTTLMISNVADTIEETNAYKQFEYFSGKFANFWQVDMFPERDDIIVFEYSDPNAYVDRGGSHGYAILVIEPWTETADADMDYCDASYMESGGGYQYFTMRDFYKRYNGYAVHFFLLDSCEAILEESKNQFFEFFNNCQFF